ncbi:RDD family protein [Kiloniella antarctica]|uniref:RDD family protein n=1 Tax=Kiloniella antarctica TaxID=1550907 RepID=A0ABW5BGY9_9PROT
MSKTLIPPQNRPSLQKPQRMQTTKKQKKVEGAWRRVITPEGVPVRLELASRGDRFAALLLDLMIVYGVPVVLIIAFAFSTIWTSLEANKGSLQILFAVSNVILFLWYNFYFTFFEIKWQGRTPGKRALGIKVVDRHGGQLRVDAVFARNLMRELELFLPLSILFSPFGSGSEGLTDLLMIIWVGLFVCIPFFNKDRLRAGDMIAGTWVVKIPKTVLMGDIAQERTRLPAESFLKGKEQKQSERYIFTDEQVDAYGIYELQTLEELLRKTAVAPKTIQEVTHRIKTKIKWVERNSDGSKSYLWKTTKGKTEEDIAFLKAYYAALRRRLEAKMLFGKRRENKHDRS